jgi:hypothetical protein
MEASRFGAYHQAVLFGNRRFKHTGARYFGGSPEGVLA